MDTLNRPLLLSLLILCADVTRCFSQSILPPFDSKKSYCVYLQDGGKVCGTGKKFVEQSDGSLLYQPRKKSYPVNTITTIETHKNIIGPAVLLGAAVGVGGGAALIATIGRNKGSSGDPTGTSIAANLAGVALIILGPVVGGLVGHSLQEGSTEVIYPTALKTSSGTAPGIGFSGRY